MKINYLVIPLIVFFVSFLGGQLTSSGMDWYKTIKLPSWTPPGSVIGLVWAIIFILSAISIILIWNKLDRAGNFNWIISIFILNALLNIFWSYLFFYQGQIGFAIIEAAILALSVLALIILIWPVYKPAAILLIPYVVWVSFATFLTYSIWILNK